MKPRYARVFDYVGVFQVSNRNVGRNDVISRYRVQVLEVPWKLRKLLPR